MTPLYWRFFIAILGVVLAGIILNIHWHRKDGLGRIFILVYTASAFAYFLIRLASLTSYHVLGWPSSGTLMDILRWGIALWLIPMFAILGIEYFYKYKK